MLYPNWRLGTSGAWYLANGMCLFFGAGNWKFAAKPHSFRDFTRVSVDGIAFKSRLSPSEVMTP